MVKQFSRAVLILLLMLISMQITDTLHASTPDQLIAKLFRFAPTTRWGHLNLNQLALRDFANVNPNPLIDPTKCTEWIKQLHRSARIDFSYGGHLEDRKDLWRGHYHKKGETIHLGVDYNVPQGTKVFAPRDSQVVEVWQDPDMNGGWGGRVILRNSNGLYLVLAHFDPVQLPAPNAFLKEGQQIGIVGGATVNGGWYPHLHAQSLKVLQANFDGYGKHVAKNVQDFPHPDVFLNAAP